MARRQQSAGGMDIMGVISNVPLALTFLFAIVGWWTAFIGQIVYENKYDQLSDSRGSAVGVSWFSIFLQLAVIIMLFLTLAKGTLEIYRFQLTAFISILVVFSVIGTNQGIFGAISSQLAIGAGWLLLSISNILWLLFITADDETRLALVLSSYAGDVPPSRTRSMMRQSRRTSSALGISNNQGSVTDLHSQHTHTIGGPVGTYGGGANHNGSMNGGMGTYGSGGQGYGGKGMAMGMGNGSMQSLQSSGMPQQQQQGGYAASPTVGSMGAPQQMAPRAGTPQQQQQQQPKMSTGVSNPNMPPQSMPNTLPSSLPPSSSTQPTSGAPAGAPSQQVTTTATSTTAPTSASNLKPPFEMKASFSYSASPDDPNEISFVKGEILTILDNSGKWFNARKLDGSEGIVPSNYLTFIDA